MMLSTGNIFSRCTDMVTWSFLNKCTEHNSMIWSSFCTQELEPVVTIARKNFSLNMPWVEGKCTVNAGNAWRHASAFLFKKTTWQSKKKSVLLPRFVFTTRIGIRASPALVLDLKRHQFLIFWYIINCYEKAFEVRIYSCKFCTGVFSPFCKIFEVYGHTFKVLNID